MGHVSGELFVAFDAFVKRAHHAAQRTGQAADLIRAGSEVGDAHALRRHLAGVAFLRCLSRGCKLGQGVRNRRCQHKAKTHADEDADNKEAEILFPLALNKAVNFTCCRRDRNNTNRYAVPHDWGRHDKAGIAVDLGNNKLCAVFQPSANALLRQFKQAWALIRLTACEWRRHNACDAVPCSQQEVGDDRPTCLFIQGSHLAFSCPPPDACDHIGVHPEDSDLDTTAQVECCKRLRDVYAV